jgi:hypothetical protein
MNVPTAQLAAFGIGAKKKHVISISAGQLAVE